MVQRPARAYDVEDWNYPAGWIARLIFNRTSVILKHLHRPYSGILPAMVQVQREDAEWSLNVKCLQAY
jgi:hypothetical protein